MTETIGAQRPDDPRGWLVFEGLPNDMQRAEDSALAADHARITEDTLVPTTFDRPATPTEKTLLAHLGFDIPPGLITRVRWLSYGVRTRRWPDLEQETPR